MNNTVTGNFAKIKLTFFYVPLLFLFLIFIFLYINNALHNDAYVNLQKKMFLLINSELSAYPNILNNFTQLGDCLIILSFLTLLIIYTPKLWESLISAIIISGILTGILKPLFSIQRPSAAFINDHFAVIGPKLMGHNSFPSGHSITAFTVLSVLLFAFMPKMKKHKILWSFSICSIGVLIIITRIGVGAHHPFDVTTGAIVGYISAISGILISQKYKLWCWIANKKFYPFFIVLFASCCIILITKILATNLIIFYLALISLLTTLYVITSLYVKKQF